MITALPIRLGHLLLEHSSRYPHLQAQDVYKLLYQAAMGSGHAVPDATLARTWLETECSILTPDANQPLVEQISPETRQERKVVRVHLRPYLAHSSDLDPLLKAFVRTANEFSGTTRRLEKYLSLLHQDLLQADLPFPIKELEHFLDEMRERNYPSIHHSEVYDRYYRPAYRVVAEYFIAPIMDHFKGI